MTATTISTQPAPDPQPTRRDPADQPERPRTIPWELLGASDYHTALTDLASWLAWLVPTYRVPPSVIPPCWFLHPGLIEELGHLWTAWRVTRHPEAGLGMVGLDWDSHRERATSRLRELVATAGCTGTTHSAKPGPTLNQDDNVWEANLRGEMGVRTVQFGEAAARLAAERVLLKAEDRQQLALNLLSDIAADPAHPTVDEMDQMKIALEKRVGMFAEVAQGRSQEARAQFANVTREALSRMESTIARDDLIARILIGSTAVDLDASRRRWIASMDGPLTTEQVIRAAAASHAGRIATAEHLGSDKSRYEAIADLLPSNHDL